MTKQILYFAEFLDSWTFGTERIEAVKDCTSIQVTELLPRKF
jgi:hypothetical protein